MPFVITLSDPLPIVGIRKLPWVYFELFIGTTILFI